MTRTSASRGEAGALSALADRVEREGASQKLDAEIWDALGLRRHRMPVPYYTQDLDVAVTLVPIGYLYLAGRQKPEGGFACVEHPSGHPRMATSEASTPAAALAAASLRARAAMMEKAHAQQAE